MHSYAFSYLPLPPPVFLLLLDTYIIVLLILFPPFLFLMPLKAIHTIR